MSIASAGCEGIVCRRHVGLLRWCQAVSAMVFMETGPEGRVLAPLAWIVVAVGQAVLLGAGRLVRAGGLRPGRLIRAGRL